MKLRQKTLKSRMAPGNHSSAIFVFGGWVGFLAQAKLAFSLAYPGLDHFVKDLVGTDFSQKNDFSKTDPESGMREWNYVKKH